MEQTESLASDLFFYTDDGYNCMLSHVNVWYKARVAYVGEGKMTITSYVSDAIDGQRFFGIGKVHRIIWN